VELIDFLTIKVNYHPHSGWLGFSAIGRKDKSTQCFLSLTCNRVRSTRFEKQELICKYGYFICIGISKINFREIFAIQTSSKDRISANSKYIESIKVWLILQV